jgi:Metallo-beta-lactamase superfamily
VDVGDPGPDGTAAVAAALSAAGSAVKRLERLVVTHAHLDHFGLAGEVLRRSGGDLWKHRRTELDLAKYDDREEAVDRRTLMLADHGLYGRELTETSEGSRTGCRSCHRSVVVPGCRRWKAGPSAGLDGHPLALRCRLWAAIR